MWRWCWVVVDCVGRDDGNVREDAVVGSKSSCGGYCTDLGIW